MRAGKFLPTKPVIKRIFKALDLDVQKLETGIEDSSDFDQREFDTKLAKARSLGVNEKRAILVMVNSFLRNRDAELLVSNWDRN
jgi:hypothetical protein